MITFLPISNSTIVIDFGIVRFQGNRFAVVLDGLARSPFFP